MSVLQHVRAEARSSPDSGISEIIDYGRERPGLIPLWAGEGDLSTPDFISKAASDALIGGETFYTWQRGLPELRAALARYYTRHFGRRFSAEEFLVTGSGMHSIQLALQTVAGAGDECLVPTPAWPNFAGALGISGGVAVPVPFDFTSNGWVLDVEKLAAAVTPRTRAIFINTPANPTGWTADHDQLRAILALARQHGLWIISDEIYALFSYGSPRAPSFLDVAEPEDRIVYINSFSKNWAMTGWRIGWIRVDPSLQMVYENLIQYSNSGVAQFMQRGAVAALDEGDDFIASQVERAHKARDIVCEALKKTGRTRFSVPQGAFYLLFSVDGLTNSREAAFRIVDEANVGLAPGSAFGAGGDPWLRLCFHRRLDEVEEAADRLNRWIARLT